MELFSAKAATLAELKAVRRELMESPLKVADGSVFQFAEDDQRTILGAIPGMAADNLTIGWRQVDNTEVPVNAAQLQAYYDEMKLLNSRRGIAVDAHYMTLKAKSDLLQRDLVDWKAQVAADWWE